LSRGSGAGDLHTALGEGTTFVLSWPASATSSRPADADADADAGRLARAGACPRQTVMM